MDRTTQLTSIGFSKGCEQGVALHAGAAVTAIARLRVSVAQCADLYSAPSDYVVSPPQLERRRRARRVGHDAMGGMRAIGEWRRR